MKLLELSALTDISGISVALRVDQSVTFGWNLQVVVVAYFIYVFVLILVSHGHLYFLFAATAALDTFGWGGLVNYANGWGQFFGVGADVLKRIS